MRRKGALGSLHRGAAACKGGSHATAAPFGGGCEPGAGASQNAGAGGGGSRSAGGNRCLLGRELRGSLGQWQEVSSLNGSLWITQTLLEKDAPERGELGLGWDASRWGHPGPAEPRRGPRCPGGREPGIASHALASTSEHPGVRIAAWQLVLAVPLGTGGPPLGRHPCQDSGGQPSPRGGCGASAERKAVPPASAAVGRALDELRAPGL